MPQLTVHISGIHGEFRDTYSDFGHMWYSLDGKTDTTVKEFGFHPLEDRVAIGPGRISNTDNEDYTHPEFEKIIDISDEQYDRLRAFGEHPEEYGFSRYYVGVGHNCVNFTFAALNFIDPYERINTGFPLPTWNIGFVSGYLDYLSGQKDHLLSTDSWPPKRPRPPIDPLVLDLNNDGIRLTNVETSKAFFDFDSDGYREKTGWLAGDDGFLFLDKDDDGKVSGAEELFGNQQLDGFSALAMYDQNGDGEIDSNDVIFSKLGVWRDLDGDGSSTSNEIFSLSQSNVSKISLQTTPSDETIAGNRLGHTGSFMKLDGQTGIAATAYFQTDRVISRWIEPDGFIISSEAARLPNLKGYGQLKDFRAAATLDPGLVPKMNSFVDDSSSMSGAELRSAFANILYEWAGAENIDAGSRGPFVNAQHIAFLEKFFAEPITEVIHGVLTDHPDERYGKPLEQTFNEIFNALLTRALSMVPLTIYNTESNIDALANNPYSSLLSLGYNDQTDQFDGYADITLDDITKKAPTQIDQKIAYFDRMSTAVAGLAVDFFDYDSSRFRSETLPGLVKMTTTQLVSSFFQV